MVSDIENQIPKRQKITLCGRVGTSRKKQYAVRIDDLSILNDITKNCACGKWCLKQLSPGAEQLNFSDSVKLIRICRNEIMCMSYSEIKDYLRNKVIGYAKGERGVSGRLKVEYKLPVMSIACTTSSLH